MATKVLVFESDPAFAGELRNEFGKLGCATTVVDDGNLGLQQAVLERPDLILLSIELPRMNGFSVCNKLKKDPNLKDVPLIIMSSESSDETFEQHKKLRTRAQDYVHKPIAFGQLLLHIQGFVALAPMAHESEGMIVIDDEIEIGSTDYVTEVTDDQGEDVVEDIPMPQSTGRRIETVDADVDAFAESAFGRLTGPDAPATEAWAPRNGTRTDGPSATGHGPLLADPVHGAGHFVDTSVGRPPSVRPPSDGTPPASQGRNAAGPASAGVDWGDHQRLVDELARVKERFDEVDRAFEEARTELERLRADAGEAERRGREIEELKSKLASGVKGAAVSSREFLDLREALNRKDKELLTLKELSSKKDKQIVEAQDRALASERAHADLDERLLLLERELGDTREKTESLTADRDLAKKASDDFRTRLEKSRADSEAKERQLTELRGWHAEELMAAEEKFAAMRADLDQTLANERAEHARALDQSEERRKGDLDRVRREQEAQLAAERSQWQEEVERARAEVEQHAHAAIDELRTELEAKGARELGEANDRAAKSAHDLTAAREQIASLGAERDELESQLAVGAARLASLEAELGSARQEFVEVKQRLMGESARADKAQAKWQADRQSLERAKDALAVSLAQIEEAEERPIE